VELHLDNEINFKSDEMIVIDWPNGVKPNKWDLLHWEKVDMYFPDSEHQLRTLYQKCAFRVIYKSALKRFVVRYIDEALFSSEPENDKISHMVTKRDLSKLNELEVQ